MKLFISQHVRATDDFSQIPIKIFYNQNRKYVLIDGKLVTKKQKYTKGVKSAWNNEISILY